MKCISLWQPWASAIPLKLKGIETRGWTTKVRGRIGIHASQRWTKAEREFAAIERELGRLPGRLPLGAIVGTALLVDVLTTDELLATGAVDPIEKIYGDYRPGRYGWILAAVVPLEEQIPWKGKQGWFEVPDDLFPVSARGRS
jgi:hypothetical protein